jgi:hypothetical protein
VIASEAELVKQLGHGTRDVFQKYLSNHMRVDLQGLATDGNIRSNQIDTLRSIRFAMREDARKKTPKFIFETVQKEAEYIALCKEREVKFNDLRI